MSSTVGHECFLYYNTGTQQSPTWSAIDTVRDVNLTLSSNEVDDTSRTTQGWRSKLPGLREWGADFEMIYDTSNTPWAAIRDAYLAGTAVEILALDGDINVDGKQGLRGTVFVTEFTRAEPLEDVVSNSTTFVGNGTPSWVVSSGGSVVPVTS